jgi:ABC-type glycerol-3-phosphate transport system substrate-binding protein
MDHPLIRFAPKRVRLDRRALLARSVIAGAASATFAAPAVIRAAAAQDSTPAAKVSGDLVEWGFGTAETNPLARSRVEAFQKAYPDVKLQVVESFDEQKLLTAAASDTVPDVIWLSRFETATWRPAACCSR